MKNISKSISKTLSDNDTGATGGHQAGMLIPKREDLISFFPQLDTSAKNPRAAMYFMDISDKVWKFQFIYYNNKFFGGTRNEYRLTGMTRFYREANLKSGDEVILTREENQLLITYSRKKDMVKEDEARYGAKKTIIVLGGGWKVINY